MDTLRYASAICSYRATFNGLNTGIANNNKKKHKSKLFENYLLKLKKYD